MLLLHAIFVRALAPSLQTANLVVAGVALLGGLAFRRLQRATAVLAVMFAFGLFTFIYMFGLAAPLSYLALVGRPSWMPWTALAAVLVLGSFILFRVRESLRREWSKPLEETPGVHIATEGLILRREFGATATPVLNVVASVLGVAFVAALAILRGNANYLLLVMFVAPPCIALLMADAVARTFGFYLAVRRWETQHAAQLRFPRLSWRRPRERIPNRPKKRRR